MALYDIAPMDEDSMDRWEGVGLDIYRRTRVRVHTLEGEENAWTYVLNAYEGGLPSARYLGEVADAAESAGAPHDYVMELPQAPLLSHSPRQKQQNNNRNPVSSVIYARRRKPATLFGVNASLLPDDIQGDPYAAADAAAARLRELTGAETHDVALVMGSGWAPAVDALGAPETDLQVTDLPGFPKPAVEGHGGKIRSYSIGDKRALVFLGRTHYYEGHGVAAVSPRRPHGRRRRCQDDHPDQRLRRPARGHAPRPARPDQRPHQPHRYLPHRRRQLRRPDRPLLPRLRALCKEVDPTLEEGVYAQFPGPHYETPAEIRMARVIGADLVGMSTVLEAIAAREAGAEVLGISLVTNLAAGMTGEPLNHEEVLQAGRDSATRMGSLLTQVLGRL